jgi:hypothetical protein
MKLLNSDKKVLVFNLINGALKLIPTVVKEVSEDEYKELNENKFFNFYKDEGKIKIVDEDTKSDKKEDTKVVLNDEIFNSLSDEDLVRSYKVTELKKYLKSKGLENLNGKKEVELIQMGRELNESEDEITL